MERTVPTLYITMSMDAAAKAGYCAAMCVSARALADAVPDDYTKRLVARSVFLHIVEFIRWARVARNGARGQRGVDGARLEALKTRLNVLADRDWGPYERLRHRVAAHRQPVAGTDDPNSWGEAVRIWGDVDADLVGVLVDDVVEIWGELAIATRQTSIAQPVIDPAMAAGLASLTRPTNGLEVGVGSFSATRPNTAALIQGGRLGERLREINDALDHSDELARILPHVSSHLSFRRIVVGGLVIELCNLLELLLEIPSARAPQNAYPPVLELVDSASATAAELIRAQRAIDPIEVEKLRRVRNSVAAHIDDISTLSQALAWLDGLDLQVVANVGNELAETLSRVAATDLDFALLRLRGTRLEGVTRERVPELERPY